MEFPPGYVSLRASAHTGVAISRIFRSTKAAPSDEGAGQNRLFATDSGLGERKIRVTDNHGSEEIETFSLPQSASLTARCGEPGRRL